MAQTPQQRDAIADMATPLRAFIRGRVPPDHVEDVLQDALLRVHERSDQLRDDTRFAAWVYRIGRNAIADHYRTALRALETPDAELDSRAADVNATAHVADADDEAVFRRAMGRWMARAVGELPAPYAEALRRVELDGQSQAQAAAQLGMSSSGLRTRVQRGRALLRQRVQRECELHFDARDRLVGCTPRDCSCDN